MSKPTRNPSISLKDAMGVLRRQLANSRAQLAAIERQDEETYIEFVMCVIAIGDTDLRAARDAAAADPTNDTLNDLVEQEWARIRIEAELRVNQEQGEVETATEVRFAEPELRDEDDDASTIDSILDAIVGRRTKKKPPHE